MGGGGWLRLNLVIALAEFWPSLGQAEQLSYFGPSGVPALPVVAGSNKCGDYFFVI